MARKRRKRLKRYAGGGVLLCILFLLGDSYGLFRADDDGPEGTATGSFDPDANDPDRGRLPERLPADQTTPQQPRPDAELASNPRSESDEIEKMANVGDVRQEIDVKPGETVMLRKAAALVDELMGIIARYESAISADDVAGLAVLVDRVRARPITAPASLEDRWKTVQARAETTLVCGDRIRSMVAQGEILQAERLIAPILDASTPQWMRARLDAATKRFGWPALSRDWQIVDLDRESGDVKLANMRRVRFVKDGELHEGTLLRSDADRATVRFAGAGGFTFPVVARGDVEPVEPKPEEALAQGVAAARESRARRVALWSCHLHEHGETANETRLRALIR